jgi:hypothetical protein
MKNKFKVVEVFERSRIYFQVQRWNPAKKRKPVSLFGITLRKGGIDAGHWTTDGEDVSISSSSGMSGGYQFGSRETATRYIKMIENKK